jgi:hypothetical protein
MLVYQRVRCSQTWNRWTREFILPTPERQRSVGACARTARTARLGASGFHGGRILLTSAGSVGFAFAFPKK